MFDVMKKLPVNDSLYTLLISLIQSNLDYPDLDYPDFFSGPVFFMNISKLWSQKLSEVKNV